MLLEFVRKEVLVPEVVDDVIQIKDSGELLSPVLAVVALQYLAYYTSLEKGFDVDKPRKSCKICNSGIKENSLNWRELRMEINKRIEEARKSMKKHKVDAYIVTSSDYHQSEYIGGYFKGREYLSGFTGSAGILVIFNDELAYGQMEDIISKLKIN